MDNTQYFSEIPEISPLTTENKDFISPRSDQTAKDLLKARFTNCEVADSFSVNITNNQIQYSSTRREPKNKVNPNATHFIENTNETVDVYTAIEMMKTNKSLKIHEIKSILDNFSTSLSSIIDLLQTKANTLNLTRKEVTESFTEAQNTVKSYFDECKASLEEKCNLTLTKLDQIYGENMRVCNEVDDSLREHLNRALDLEKQTRSTEFNIPRVDREIQDLAVESKKNFKRVYVTAIKFDNFNAISLKKYLSMIGEVELDFLSVNLEPKEESKDNFYFNTKYCFGNDQLFEEHLRSKKASLAQFNLGDI